MLNARKACAGYGHTGESLLQGYGCQIAKASTTRLVTFRECVYNGLYNNKLKLALGPKSMSGQYAMQAQLNTPNCLEAPLEQANNR